MTTKTKQYFDLRDKVSFQQLRFYDHIRKIIANRSRKIITDKNRIPSAVLLLLYEKQGKVHLLFTKRTETVAAHKGQISFPGGVRDQKDASYEDTALREAYEEVGVDPGKVEILGLLDDLVTVSTHFVITPVVGFLRFPASFRINPREVEGVIEIPLDFFYNLFTKKQYVSSPEKPLLDNPEFHYGEHLIWGATARILIQFLSLLTADNKVR